MKTKIQIIDIAKEAGLSIASVSRVLNGRTGVSEKVRKQISDIVKKYNYVSTSHLTRERKIALLIECHAFSNYIDELFEGIIKYSVENSIGTAMIFKNDSLKLTFLEQIRDQQCSGVIVAPPVSNYDVDALAESDLPVILLDDSVYKEGLGFIDHDAYSGSREATNYLLQLGHKNIGYIEYGIKALNHLKRFKAYENTLNEAGIEIKSQWHVKVQPKKPLYQEAYLKMKELLEQAPELTAVMTTNDNLALSAIKAIVDSGKKVPDDISVIGFDNYKNTEYLNPALTTVNHPIEEIGYTAAREIDLCWKNPQKKELPKDILPTKLIIRESTCKCRDCSA